MTTQLYTYYAVFDLLPKFPVEMPASCVGSLPVFVRLEDAVDYNNARGGQLQIVAFSIDRRDDDQAT